MDEKTFRFQMYFFEQWVKVLYAYDTAAAHKVFERVVDLTEISDWASIILPNELTYHFAKCIDNTHLFAWHDYDNRMICSDMALLKQIEQEIYFNACQKMNLAASRCGFEIDWSNLPNQSINSKEFLGYMYQQFQENGFTLFILYKTFWKFITPIPKRLNYFFIRDSKTWGIDVMHLNEYDIYKDELFWEPD